LVRGGLVEIARRRFLDKELSILPGQRSRRDPDIPASEEGLPLSTLLLTLAEGGQAPVSVDEIIAHFGRRAFGAILFVFAVPNLLPLPPGSSTFLSLPLLIIAPQLAGGAKEPWIPRALGRRTVDRAVLARICQRSAPWVARAERLTTQRFGFMFGRVGDLAIGVVCTLLSAVLVLPIPLGNMLPAAAIAALALSLTQRDGLMSIVGYLTALTSVGVLALSGRLVMAAVARLGTMAELW